MSVDFPAPFSPTRAWISPAWTVRLTLSSACTPGNVLVIPRISRIAVIGHSQIESGARDLGPSMAENPAQRRAGSETSVRSVDLAFLVIAAVHQHRLPVGSVHADRLQEVGRNGLHAVLVGLGVVHLDL